MDTNNTTYLEQTLAPQQELIKQLLLQSASIQRQIARANLSRKTWCKFLKLPREVRDMIYYLCLCPGKVYSKPAWHSDQRYADRRPLPDLQWQLMLVNRQVREESIEALLRGNMIVLSELHQEHPLRVDAYGPILPHLIAANLANPSTLRLPVFRSFAVQHLASLSISFDLRTFLGDALRHARAIQTRTRRRPGPLTTSGRPADSHTLICTSGSSHWNRLVDLLRSLNLRTLQLDFTNCLCPTATHRLVCVACSALRLWCPKERLQSMEVLGTWNVAERENIIKTLVDTFDDQINQNKRRWRSGYSPRALPEQLLLRFEPLSFSFRDRQIAANMEDTPLEDLPVQEVDIMSRVATS